MKKKAPSGVRATPSARVGAVPPGCRSAAAATAAAIVVALGVVSSQASARVVSLVPALTDILLAIDARQQLVGVSSYDDDPQVQALPRVGALLDPDVERIIALKPDLVVTYGTQQDLLTQLARASIATFPYRHGGLADVFATMRSIGARVGRRAQAEALARSLEQRVDRVRSKVASAPKPRTLLVFGRERGSLRAIYVSGGRGFLHDMLEAAGGRNVYGDVDAESVQASSEMILSRAPEAIVELRSEDIPAPSDRAREMEAWNTLTSVPAVRQGRLYLLSGKSTNVPGPLVADGIEQMARVLHPEAFK